MTLGGKANAIDLQIGQWDRGLNNKPCQRKEEDDCDEGFVVVTITPSVTWPNNRSKMCFTADVSYGMPVLCSHSTGHGNSCEAGEIVLIVVVGVVCHWCC